MRLKTYITKVLILVISGIFMASCGKDTNSVNSSSNQLKPVSESDTIQIPKYKPEQLSQKAINSIKGWITFNELNQAILTIGAYNYQKKEKVTRSNYLMWSEDFSNPKWNKKAVDIVKDTIPSFQKDSLSDGLNATTLSSPHFVRQNYSIGRKNTVTLSVQVKAGEAPFAYLSGESKTPSEKGTAVFNLKEGKVDYEPEKGAAAIKQLGDGWYLCSYTFESNPRGDAVIGVSESPSQFIFESTKQIDVYLWGAQLENKTSVGSYLPTTNVINTIEEYIQYVPKPEELEIINSSYQKLYFQVDDIYRRIEDVEKGSIPLKYKTPYILSRLRNLKTNALLLTDALRNNSYLTNEEVNNKLKDIYKTYNSILNQINNLNDDTLEENMNSILKRQE
ncbi:hypothetical protein NBRC110019_05270 [Neptunitalea chrysea]|uniref:Lipoprotein n=1 Tax=Neptunitalea chrysea TaxID=1647581 RepID=A0A9W6EVF9_9FLAO|nr:hypothetical protein [Neptunitalea chrysea]GLB51488.1 hypothetical protein NBRC110019_05270 [Neptunitalea chrysea]